MADDESSLSPCPWRSPSPSTPFSPSPPPISLVQPSSSPPPIIQPSDSVTVASTVPHLALPIQPPPGSNPAGGCREDCWSEGATSALIDAWGERYLLLNRGNLKQKQWQEVADAVISRDDYSKTPKSDIQCKNRIDTLKKKYKIEKSKIAAGTSSASSSWPFFHRLDLLLAPSFKPSASAVKKPKHPPPPPPPPATFPQKQRTNLSAKRKGVSRPPVSASSSSDSVPPSAAAAAEERQKTAPFGGIKELALSILKFGEVYQRVERSKLEQSMEMERQRMEFSQELEMQRLQFFMKTQMELSHLKRRNGSSGAANDGSNKRRWHRHQSPANNCNNNGKQNGK